MTKPQITVVNQSTAIQNDQIPPVLAALQRQIEEDFAPAWGIRADLSFVMNPKEVPSGAWILALLDDPDQAGSLGYHDLTASGQPLGKVFARTEHRLGARWTVTASHELLEMLVDPDINLTACVESDRGSVLYAYEVCDACEGIEYKIDGIYVSDFVYPAWFESFRRPRSTRFDHRETLQAPFDLSAGGYIGVYDVAQGGGWQQMVAQGASHRARDRARVGSRRERRRTPRRHWLKSTF